MPSAFNSIEEHLLTLKADILQPSASFQPSFSEPFLQMYIHKNVFWLIFNEL